MALTKQERMQLFLDQNYVTLTALAKACDVSEKEILNLESAQCIPGHTYEVRQVTVFSCAGIDSASTENTAISVTWYYHNSIIIWAQQALLALRNNNLAKVASEIKDNFAQQLKQSLGEIKTPGCQNFDQAWGYWIDGTWGKCLKDLSINGIARKELSRLRIAEIMQEDPQTINSDTKIELTNSVKQYISASLDFDTYGTRYLLAEEAIKKFQLDITINYWYIDGVSNLK